MKQSSRLISRTAGPKLSRFFSVYCCLMFLVVFNTSCRSQENKKAAMQAVQRMDQQRIRTGADRIFELLPGLKGKKVGVVANPTSVIGKTHLVDTLIALGVQMEKVFAPEHGFRGEAEAGEDVVGGADKKTGVKVISLYGDHKKPVQEDMEGLDVLLFDIQDVGVRFYTYISTLQYVMEACAENGVPLIVLDRPNPHGGYVDGPVLKPEFTSFIGMQPVPVVYGMTIGEYALMLNGEGWLKNQVKCNLRVVQLQNWKHADDYDLPVAPSPNLPNKAAVRLYPSLCFFEGTDVSLGRGTPYPFQCYGFPENKNGTFEFTPVSIPGKAKTPPQMGKLCKGELLDQFALKAKPDRIHLSWLLKAYAAYEDSAKFFIPFFEKLSGNQELRQQIVSGKTEEQIRSSWQSDLQAFRKIRDRYLLYP